MVKQSSFTLHMTDEMKERLEKVAEKNGLGQSEIVRRGIVDQINQLQDKQQPTLEEL